MNNRCSREPAPHQLGRLMWVGVIGALALAVGCGTNGESDAAGAPIGTLSGERLGAEVEWGEIDHFDVASDGRVVVVDRHRRKVVVFDPHRREFGVTGDGPGELRLGGPVALVGDTIVVADEGRLTSWTTDGRHLATAPGVWGSQLHLHPTAGVVLATPVTGLDPDGVRTAVYAAGTLELLQRPGIVGDPEEICGGCQVVPFGPDRYLAAPSSPDRGPLLVGPEGTSEWSYPTSRIAWHADEWNAHLGVQRRRASYATTDPRLTSVFRAPSRARHDAPDTPKRLTRAGGALGRSATAAVVLAQVEHGENSALDFFTPDGAYLGRGALDRAGIHRISVEGDWVVGLMHDGLDRPQLWRYRIRDLLDAL